MSESVIAAFVRSDLAEDVIPAICASVSNTGRRAGYFGPASGGCHSWRGRIGAEIEQISDQQIAVGNTGRSNQRRVRVRRIGEIGSCAGKGRSGADRTGRAVRVASKVCHHCGRNARNDITRSGNTGHSDVERRRPASDCSRKRSGGGAAGETDIASGKT